MSRFRGLGKKEGGGGGKEGGGVGVFDRGLIPNA